MSAISSWVVKNWILSLGVLFVITRLPVLLYPPDSDHWIFYWVGRDWFQGGTLYLSSWDHKPPAIFFVNGVMSWISDLLIVHRTILTIVAAASVVLFYHFVQKLFCGEKDVRKIAIVSTVFFVFFTNLSFVSSSGSNTETWALPVLLIIYLLGWKNYTAMLTWIKIAGLTTILMMFKPSFALLLIPLLLDFVLSSTVKNSLKFFAIYVITVTSLVSIIVLGYYVFTGGFDIITASITFSSDYARLAWSGGVSSPMLFIIQSAIVLSPLVLLIFLSSSGQYNNKKLFIFSGLFVSILVYVIPGTFYPYYLYISSLFFALFFGVKYVGVSSSLEGWKKVGFYSFLLIIFFTTQVMSFRQLYNTFSGPIAADYHNLVLAADWIKQSTLKSDKIPYIGYGMTFNYLADRNPITASTSTSHLVIEKEARSSTKLLNHWLKAAYLDTPKYIVLSPEYTTLYAIKLPEIDEFVQNNYIQHQQYGGYVIMKKIEKNQ